MINRLANYTLVIMFMSVLLFFSISNINSVKKTVEEINKSIDTKTNVSLYLKQFEQIYKKNFYKRKELIDIYGMTLLLQGKSTVLNFNMIKTNDFDFVVLSEKNIKLDNNSLNKMVGNVLSIYKIAQKYNIPFVYIQPPSAYHKVTPEVAALLKMKQNVVFNTIKNELHNRNVNYIDMYEVLNNQNIPHENIFFRTDVHNTTFTEWETAREIIKYLENIGLNYGKEEKEKIFNTLNYDIIKNDLYGNTIRSAGDYFTKKDTFETFIPLYETQMKLKIENQEKRIGTFQQVVMNGYEKMQKKRLYYIINYGQYRKSIYTYENLSINNENSILIICDSLSMRTFSILSLLNRQITVYDPRFNKSEYALKQILESSKYDAILFSAGALGILQSKNYGLKDLYENNKVINKVN